MTMHEAGAPPSDNKVWAIVIWALYLGGFLTGVSALVGIILAYVKRADMAGTPFASHMVYAIRTFWISLIGFVIGAVLTIVVIGLLVLLLTAIWCLYRSIRGLVLAIDSRPVPDPAGWL